MEREINIQSPSALSELNILSKLKLLIFLSLLDVYFMDYVSIELLLSKVVKLGLTGVEALQSTMFTV